MNKIKFTKEQLRAINLQGKNILVYASAGSGKTTVLVSRIINHVLKGVPLDEMLIVTFTRAAANEMRERLRRGLINELSSGKLSDKEQIFIRRQIAILPSCDIETLDAFCQKVIRANFNVVNLDPNFRVMTDPNEIIELKKIPFDETFGEFLAKEGTNFFDLVRNFSNGKNIERFKNLINDLETYSVSLENQDNWLNHIDHLYNFRDSFSKGDFFQKSLKSYVKDQIKIVINLFKKIDEISKVYPQLEFYSNEAQIGITYYSQILHNLRHFNYQELREQLFAFNFARAKAVRTKDEAVLMAKNKTKGYRDTIKKILQDSNQGLIKLFQYSETEIAQLSKKVAKRIKLLISFTKIYLKKVEMVKKSENAYEFSDLERYAYKILKESKNARILYQHRFKEILIDEYQDINNLQDAILNLLSGNQHNLFMVGDVKQSIYGFRHANPQLFLKKYLSYQNSSDKNEEVIVIAENYRSVINIDETVNFIFKQLMDINLGGLKYDQNSFLKFGANFYPEKLNPKVEVLIDQSEENEISQAQQQAEIIVNQIQDMLLNHQQVFDVNQRKMRELKLSDIAILTRTKSEHRTLLDTFERAGINLSSGQNDDFFLTVEIKLIISVLKVIDNPDQDIPLVAVLKSPFVGLDDNDLAKIRANCKQGSFCQAVNNYLKNENDNLSKQLLKLKEMLRKAQNLANNNNLVDLLNFLYYDSNYLDYVSLMVGGNYRLRNLRIFLLQAKSFQERSITSLSEFVRYLDQVERSGNHPNIPDQVSNNEDAVQLMTMHSAKGLEFPVVFLYRLNRQFNFNDLNQSYLLNEDAGLGLRYLDNKNISYYLPQIEIVKQKERNRLISEELRIFYVAMTRAREKLFMVGTDKNFFDTIEQKSERSELVIPLEERQKDNSFLKMLRSVISGQVIVLDKTTDQVLSHFDSNQAQIVIKRVTHIKLKDISQEKTKFQMSDLLTSPSRECWHQIDDHFSWQYPFINAINQAAYQSVSGLKTVLREPDDNQLATANFLVKNNLSGQINEFDLPKFKGSKKANAAEIGTATHLLLRKVPLNLPISSKLLKEQVNKLVNEKLITPEVGKQINIPHILRFFDTDLGKLILKQPDKFEREKSFQAVVSPKVLYPHATFGKDDAVLIHGIFDGFLNLNDKIILLDYKTDHFFKESKQSIINQLVKRYQSQLAVYADVLHGMYHKPVKKNIVALASGMVINLN